MMNPGLKRLLTDSVSVDFGVLLSQLSILPLFFHRYIIIRIPIETILGLCGRPSEIQVLKILGRVWYPFPLNPKREPENVFCRPFRMLYKRGEFSSA